MKRTFLLLLAGIGGFVILYAQAPTNAALAAGEAATEAQEQNDLNQAVNDAANSPVDYIRALERHLLKYPNTKERAAIEKALAKGAMETNDPARIILYGERLLARESPDDMPLLERVIRALLDKGDSASGLRASVLAKRYEADVQAQREQQPPGHLSPPIWSDLIDANMASALVLEARAAGAAGKPDEAVRIAQKSWSTYPGAEAARTAAFWLSKLNRNSEAIEYYADAFTLEDPRTTSAERAGDRARLGELYRKSKHSEKGLGDLILQAYDRTAAIRAARSAGLRARDPNAEAVNLFDFILPAVDVKAPPLRLASLKGKTLVMDFWATWCIPCREQHPLIEKVKNHFSGTPDVVFLSINSDDDPVLAAPFVKEQGWETGYFEADMARRFNVSSIPTILIVEPSGQIASRITGIQPEKFETMLTQRIEETRLSSTNK